MPLTGLSCRTVCRTPTEADADEKRTAGSIGYMILTPFWSQGIGTEAVRQFYRIAITLGTMR